MVMQYTFTSGPRGYFCRIEPNIQVTRVEVYKTNPMTRYIPDVGTEPDFKMDLKSLWTQDLILNQPETPDPKLI